MEDERRAGGESSDSWRRRDIGKRRHGAEQQAKRIDRQRRRIEDRLEELRRRTGRRRR
jgi:hypothetical protein